MNEASFKSLYRNQMVPHKGKELDLGSYWLQHEQRRQYINGIILDPTETHVGEGQLNLWTGFGCEPIHGEWRMVINENAPTRECM
jgi:hypothetical protein